jgi:PIN domain nuclease of toxin-antitoxin system
VKLLLDTHSFIWWRTSPDRLTPRVKTALENDEIEVYLSVASIWEMQIKIQLNKLKFTVSLQTFVEEEQKNGLAFLPVNEQHVFRLEQLPPIHRDPFDRILIAQALVEGAQIVTDDAQIQQYPVSVFR